MAKISTCDGKALQASTYTLSGYATAVNLDTDYCSSSPMLTTTNSCGDIYVMSVNSDASGCVTFNSQYSYPILPNYLMGESLRSVVEDARKLLLDEDTKELMDSGLKNKCNLWTDEALRVFVEGEMNKPENTKTLVEISKKLNAEKKGKKDCKAC